MRRNNEKGQAILLAVVALSLLLLGALGFAIDGATLYTHQQMLQAAADAGAMAGAMSILGGTNTGTNNFTSGGVGSSFVCSAHPAYTPCRYTNLNGVATAETVTVDFPASVPGVALSPSFPVTGVRVTITRSVKTTLMNLFGSSAANIKASAIAAVVQIVSPVPIIVTHPTIPSSFDLQGNPTIQICGGPQRSIQVNSTSTTAAHAGGSARVDLSRGGPADTAGNCSTGTGTDFGVDGGPASAAIPSWMNPAGASTHYIQPAAPIHDPLASVAPPSAAGRPICNPQSDCYSPLANGASGCPASPGKPCQLFTPGNYTNGIDVKNLTGVFTPGIYYIDGGGFDNAANGDIFMCSGCTASGETGSGMLIYLSQNGGTGNTISIGANSDAHMLGSDAGSAYQGMLIFMDRRSPKRTISLGGGGNINLIGTIYSTNCEPGYTCVSGVNMTSALYQIVSLQGGSGSGTTIRGEIITSNLQMGGNGTIIMQLDPTYKLPINQVALVK